ncbi:nuclear cap-binding protein subunit 3 domain-containing protein [Sarocladium implicatum]|nr:nuclear cap-binding protein subunit 3 domain-containing protein [Sarocladium implicatum]
MDLDIDMGGVADPLNDGFAHDQPSEDILQVDDPEEPGEIADDGPAADGSKTIVPNKIHIRGVDALHTDDIKAYVKAHHGPVDRVEWIDDTSANLLFSSEAITRDAFRALSTVEIADPTALAIGETLPAKAVDGKPEVSLLVRFALESDKKEAGAASRSRYYLLHPEHDPEERRRRQQESRSRYRDRDGRDHRRDGGRRRRDSGERPVRFEASMYDDAPVSSRSRDSDSDDRSRSHARENRGKELFADRRGSARNRSASPARDRDSDVDLMGERASSTSNRSKARNIKGRLNASRELFPSKMSSGSRLDELEDAIGSAHLREEDRPKIVAAPDQPAGGGAWFSIKGSAAARAGDMGSGFSIKGAANAKELFPDKLGGDNSGKELLDGSRRRRQRAEDLFS